MKILMYGLDGNEYIHKSRNPKIRTLDNLRISLHNEKIKKSRIKTLPFKPKFKTIQGKIKRLKFVNLCVQGKIKHYFPSKLLFNGKIIIMHDTLYDFYYNN